MKHTRFAIIGAGNIGGIHAHAIGSIKEAAVVAVCDKNEVIGRKLAEKYSADWVPTYQDIASRDDVEIACICTPSGLHTDAAEVVTAAGKHILVEKPMDITLERIDRMIRSARQNSVFLGCVFPSRFRIGVLKAKEAIEQGRLGRIVLLQGNIKWFRKESYYNVGWRGTWKLDGGGALMNQSIHTIDLVQWFGGPIKSIFGKTATLRHTIQTEDTGSALLEFENGALGVIQGATSCYPGSSTRIEIHGTAGTIILEEGEIVEWAIKGASKDECTQMLNLEPVGGSGSQDPMGITSEFHRRQIVDMINAVQNKQQPAVTGEEGRKAVEIILAIYSSSQSNMPVKLPL
ncbi:Gfo/Idh/MocA family oxidoreductase [candidate division KSB1 bacterium]|nr:Gfo/Idh/MocA family oxidoreductase [candidate division KSB1 bacterium]